MSSLRWIWLCGWLLTLGCYAEPELVYPCHGNANCVQAGVQGVCVPTGSAAYCAFVDSRCPGGLRFDASAPATIEGNCVALPDAGFPGG
jgi:hypothetical protein